MEMSGLKINRCADIKKNSFICQKVQNQHNVFVVASITVIKFVMIMNLPVLG